MKNLNWKRFIWALVAISVVFLYLIAWYRQIDIAQFKKLISLIPDVVALDWVVFFIFIQWGWKIKLFQGWLVPFPDLNGTWEGEIRSEWVDPVTNKSVASIPAMLTINQSFLYISCVIRTGEMTSYSFAEGFKINEKEQIKQLVYSYTSKPKPAVINRNVVHEGTIVFNITGNPANKLVGHYWTARKTIGEVEVRFKNKKILDEIPVGFPKHPMA